MADLDLDGITEVEAALAREKKAGVFGPATAGLLEEVTKRWNAAEAEVRRLRAEVDGARAVLDADGHAGTEKGAGLAARVEGAVRWVRALMEEKETLRTRAESAEMGCEIAYHREPTQAEGDAFAAGADECFVPMGGWTGRRCRHCGRWCWGGPTACVPCVARAEEREACARVCDDEAARMPDRHLSTVAADLADRIRARGDQ